ncbi:D-proline reductase (dithiol) PrdB [Garciella nitratireducens DSM 15102]|uniref:D-proline reductase (Dithiol) PrdB n=1 Tax=Garciella nitratireducens DSM 15102 TaxID=1121911 RepID=A0A1T4LJU3_9FIRM|nr:D-proline reductase (dithiol) PrdB [Garciella nitratireducens DSM 15102]
MIVQRAIEEIGIPTIIIAALPPVVRQNGTPRAVAPLVPMGANAGEPNNPEMQRNIVRDALKQLVEIQTPGKIVPLPYEYIAKV